MESKEFHKFFDWAASGAAAASLAFFGLLFSTGVGHHLFSIGLFLFAMFALVTASALSKMISNNTNESDVAEHTHTLVTSAGFGAFIVGLGLMAVNMSYWLAIPFILGLAGTLFSVKRVHNALLREEV
jgi:hypothetical protein